VCVCVCVGGCGGWWGGGVACLWCGGWGGAGGGLKLDVSVILYSLHVFYEMNVARAAV
jgi:hypothetical protein